MLPSLRYPVTQSYPWPFFTSLVTIGVLIALGVLVPINVALTGYTFIIESNRDHNFVPHHWWDRFTGAPTPGNSCDPYEFNADDEVTTNYTLFHYTIISPNIRDISQTIEYEGTRLDSCDVFSLGVDANAMSKTVALSATVLCNSTDFPVLMRMSFTPWGLNSDVSRKNAQTLATKDYSKLRGTAAVPQLLVDASYDLFYSMVANAGDPEMAYAVTLVAQLTWCPASFLASGTEGCTPDIVNKTYDFTPVTDLGDGGALTLSSGVPVSRTDGGPYVKPEPLNNLLQILSAAIRLDLGRVFPNNVLPNQTMVDSTISTIADGPQNWLIEDLQTPDDFNIVYPLSPPNSVSLNVEYTCYYYRAKTWGEIFIAVLVATSTMFHTGWAATMVVARYFARRKVKTDEEHAIKAPKRPSRHTIEKSASYVAKGLDYVEKIKDELE